MGKENQLPGSNQQNVVNMLPPYKKFKMDLKIQRNKPHYKPPSNTLNITSSRLQRMNESNIHLNLQNNNNNHSHHHYQMHNQMHNQRRFPPVPPQVINNNHNNHNHNNTDDTSSYYSHNSHSGQSYVSSVTSNTASTTCTTSYNNNNNNNNTHNISSNNSIYVENPFNDPPSECKLNDIRWVWRKTLEERRGDIKNRKYYANYVGSKKSRRFYTIRTADPSKSQIESQTARLPYCGNHHLKHLVKIGCPLHDLYPIFNKLGYNVNRSICTHKSFLCNHGNLNDNYKVYDNVSLKNIGLIFKRNAFSTKPLNIVYNGNTSGSGNNECVFNTNLYIKRIANTNFSKAFRPGSYGKLSSLKKGSWKEGKIFYVFDGDDLIMHISQNILIKFVLKSCASSSDNEQNTIDGWKNIVGGVGLYKSSDSRNILSVLVLRKSPDLPLECLENSKILIYIRKNANINGTLNIGSKGFIINNKLNNNNNNNNMQYTPPSILPATSLSYSTSNTSSNNSNNRDDDDNDLAMNDQLRNNNINYNYNNNVSYNNNIPSNNVPNEIKLMIRSIRQEYETKYNLLSQKHSEVSSLNIKLMQDNNQLIADKQQLTQNIQALQCYMEEQNQQLNTMNEQDNNSYYYNSNNSYYQPSVDAYTCNSVDAYNSTMFSNNNNLIGVYNENDTVY